MRNKLIAVILLLIALSFITYGILLEQYSLINSIYDQMAVIP